eukprot:TRINITY_DN1008_c0_g3_i1.p1 TRINITY_DN1008_c0_g3~~TRINITY_DN1008_c0_g3_i1.p1  ORF type:complete len:163 (+),score=59.41 TRINITY_DN1008_c0_g3_i1:86-574(+)
MNQQPNQQPMQAEPVAPGQYQQAQPMQAQPMQAQPMQAQPMQANGQPMMQAQPVMMQQGQMAPQMQMPMQQQGVVMMQQPKKMKHKAKGRFPERIQCKHCHAEVTTSTTLETGTGTWVFAGVLCFIGCWPCCLLPFVMDSMKDVKHHCPNCGKKVGEKLVMS